MRWWRDNAHRIPWLPPPGDGSRYRRMLAAIDPQAPSDEELIRELRAKAQAQPSDRRAWQPVIAPAFAAIVSSALPPPDETAPGPALVDWSFLDQDDGQPGELPGWARKQIELFGGEIGADIALRSRWSRPIKPPATPPRYNPDDPPFDPGEDLDWMDDDGGEAA